MDGIHTKVRLGGDDRLCCLVMVGVRLDGKKELVAVRDGYRESEESSPKITTRLKRCSAFSERLLGTTPAPPFSYEPPPTV